MRRVLPPSLLLLALILLLNLQSGVYDGMLSEPGTDRNTVSTGTTVRIFSCGMGLLPERFDRRVQAQAIIVDGDLHAYDTGYNGLRVATFFVGGDEIQFQNYDLAKSDEDVAAFVEHVRAAPVGAVMAMAVFRFIDPRGQGREERAKALGRVFADISARSRPETLENPSWAYLCIRRRQGWVPLSEMLSQTKGVMLAYQLSPDPSVLDRVRPELLIERNVRFRLVSIYPYGQTRLGPFALARHGYDAAFEVNRVKRDGISASPPYGPKAKELGTLTNRIVLPYVRLGPRASFEVQLGMESYHRPKSKGVEFQVVVDAEIADRRGIAVDPNEPDAWLPWTVDLAAWGNRWVSLELRTVRLALAPGATPQWAEPVIWGDPTLVSFHDGEAAEQTDWDRLLTVLDQNRDSVLQRAEALGRLKFLDANGDGRLSADESPPEFPWLVQVVDVDGDGAADGQEIESFYDRMPEAVPRTP